MKSMPGFKFKCGMILKHRLFGKRRVIMISNRIIDVDNYQQFYVVDVFDAEGGDTEVKTKVLTVAEVDDYYVL